MKKQDEIRVKELNIAEKVYSESQQKSKGKARRDEEERTALLAKIKADEIKLIQQGLFYAVEDNNVDKILSHLDKGADINGQNVDLMTPVMLAISDNCKKALQKLLKRKGVNLTLKNKDGQTAMDIAVAYGRKPFQKMLKSYKL